MKCKVPAREIKVCDFCRLEGFLEACCVCGKEYCLTCHGIVAGSYGFHKLCRECACLTAVQQVCDRYAKKMALLFAARDKALARLEVHP